MTQIKNKIMLIKKIVIIALIIFAVSNPTFAKSTYSGFASLKIIPSARECAMGGAGVISAIGPQAMYFNPALTSDLKSFAFNFNYTKWFLDMCGQSVFLVRPLPYFNIGAGVVNFNAGAVEFRPDHPTESSISEFNPADFNFYLNLSRSIEKDKFTAGFGISGRYYYEKIYDRTATTLAADLGLSLKILSSLRIGFSIVNFGTSMKFIRERFSLPTKFLSGIEYDINLSKNKDAPKIRLTGDFGYRFNTEKTTLNSGVELSFKDKYFIRAGYKSSEEANHYNFGFGLIVKKFRIEYAYSPYDLDIGSTNHFSISLGY